MLEVGNLTAPGEKFIWFDQCETGSHQMHIEPIANP
jgi:hypothetical protein